MTVRLLKVLAIVAPIVFIGLFEMGRHYLSAEGKVHADR